MRERSTGVVIRSLDFAPNYWDLEKACQSNEAVSDAWENLIPTISYSTTQNSDYLEDQNCKTTGLEHAVLLAFCTTGRLSEPLGSSLREGADVLL